MVRFMMEDTLRFLTEDSLEMFAKFLEVSAASTVKVNSTCDVVVVKIWVRFFIIVLGHVLTCFLLLFAHVQEQTKFPLFMVDLQVHNSEFILSTQPRQFEERILSLFEKALASVDNIPQVERAIMKYLFWSHSPILASVHKRDPKVLAAIQIAKAALCIHYISSPPFFPFHFLYFLSSILDKALSELDGYVHTYDHYKEFLKLDVNEYLKIVTTVRVFLTCKILTLNAKPNCYFGGLANQGIIPPSSKGSC